MKIEFKEQIGLTGKKIELSAQELIAIKDKWEELTQKNNPKKRHFSEATTRVDTILLEDFDALIGKITEGIQSSKEVHDDLFCKEKHSEEVKLTEADYAKM
jgi:NADH dehydrogenase/NADH:ubiquinone oxidoreductase subunit G